MFQKGRGRWGKTAEKGGGDIGAESGGKGKKKDGERGEGGACKEEGRKWKKGEGRGRGEDVRT